MREKRTVIIETERLLLCHFTAFDEQNLGSLLGDPDVMEFSLGVKTPIEIKTWLKERLLGQERDPSIGLFAVLLKENEQFIGYCGFVEYQDLGGQPETEIGYRLVKSEWGKGYATEAALAARDYGFGVLNRVRLVALIDPGNHRSIAVAEKIGMRFEKEVVMEGYTYSDHLYSLVRL